MARATRSSAQNQEKDTEESPSQSRTKATKKRKRQSTTEQEDQRASKQLRGDVSIKEEGSQEPEENEHTEDETKLPEIHSAGEMPILEADARKILDILEMIDTQGLLDRVFPLPARPPDEKSNTEPSASGSYSFRTLLQESPRHPLCVLRSAVQHLFPISSHPRSRPSTPAAQQLRFCNLALSLLDQASFHSISFPLDLETLFPPTEATENPEESKKNVSTSSKSPASHEPGPTRKHKHALVQHLPAGDWWTSLSSDFALPPTDGRHLKDLPTGYAELVAIFPTLESSDTAIPTLTLGSYSVKKPPGPRPKAPGPRLVSCGSFLDYGPYASFAPTFDQTGVEVGRNVMGEVLWRREQRKRQAKSRPGRIETVSLDNRMQDEDMSVSRTNSKQKEREKDIDDVDGLDGLLPLDEITKLKAVLGSLELEEAVQELLDRNGRALQRLGELQRIRLSQEGGGSSEVKVGSEEWDIAQGILDSLTLLASLRPRSSTSEIPPLIPSASCLRKLHHTLPVTPSQGWYGTLPANKTGALRDDTTLRIKPGAVITPAPAPQTNTSTSVVPVTNGAPTPVYPGYAYPNYAQYRTGAMSQTPYKPGQTPSYYPSTYATQGQGTSQNTTGNYYPNYQYSTATTQQQYQYGATASWYNLQSQASVATGANSGRGTPQPTPTPATPTSYAGFFNNQAQPGRAVANTVVTAAANKMYPQNVGTSNTWNASTAGTSVGYAPPTLPAHLRTSGGTSHPGTPTVGGYSQPNYYGYQPTPPAAR